MAVCLCILSGRAASIIFFNVIGSQLENNCDNFLLMVAGLILCKYYTKKMKKKSLTRPLRALLRVTFYTTSAFEEAIIAKKNAL